MAEKRMFAKSVVESGDFYSLSVKAQCLYFHLGMLADDDGLLNNALVICKGCGFPKSVLDELIQKRFLLDLGDNITCIKHWMINNTIKADRKKETLYPEKMGLLRVKENRSYTECFQKRKQSGDKTETNVSIDKNSIDKYRLDKNSDDDINNINARMSILGVSDETLQEAMRIFNKKNYPKTSGFYQRVINTLTDEHIYDKEAYISEVARNYG